MSSLRNMHNTMKLLTKQKRPSPKQINILQCKKEFPCCKTIMQIVKRISHLISGRRFARKWFCRASMTVEAAIVMPLFLFFLFNMGYVMEFIRFHGNVEMALWDAGERMTVYGCLQEDPGENILSDVVSDVWMRSQLIESLGKEYLDNSPLTNGTKSLLVVSDLSHDHKDCVEFKVVSTVGPLGELAGFGNLIIEHRYYGHLWNGYDVSEADGQHGEDIVYVTENGVVYHENLNCSYLRLAVKEVSLQEAYLSRNAEGDHYKVCLICGGEDMGSNVYITEDGTAIHFNRACPGLKRTVHSIPRNQAFDYTPCHRCVGGTM